MANVTAKALKMIKLGSIKESPSLVVLEIETKEEKHFFTMPMADLDKVIEMFRQHAVNADVAKTSKVQ